MIYQLDEHIRLAFQSALEDIRFFKRQQWTVTYYTALLYGAIIAILKFIGREYKILSWSTVAIAIVSIILIIQLHYSTREARNRKNEVKKMLKERKLKDLYFGRPVTRSRQIFDEYSVTILLILMITGGAVITVWLLILLGVQLKNVPVNNTLTQLQSSSQLIEGLKFVFMNLLFPIFVALATYILVDRLGEWRKRRTYSKLGVAVMEALLEEVKTGVRLLSKCYKMVKTNQPKPPPYYLPNRTWSGTSTISDEVLLRILATSSKRHLEKGFPPNQCRIHCKNYFEFICGQYNSAVEQGGQLALAGQDWRQPFLSMFAKTNGRFVLAAKNVQLMLEHARELLEENSKARLPK